MVTFEWHFALLFNGNFSLLTKSNFFANNGYMTFIPVLTFQNVTCASCFVDAYIWVGTTDQPGATGTIVPAFEGE